MAAASSASRAGSASKRGFAEIGDIEGIGEVGHHAFEQLLGALLHQAGIGAIDQRHHQRLGRRGDIAVGFVTS